MRQYLRIVSLYSIVFKNGSSGSLSGRKKLVATRRELSVRHKRDSG
jgi:hypothetical protein